MGLFGLFGAKKPDSEKKSMSELPSKKSAFEPNVKNIDQIIAESDRAIKEMQAADDAFEKDSDIEKRISVYEKYLLKKPQWNSFNFNLSLAKMYVKAGHNDKAWGYLNQMYLWAMDPDAVGGDASKIRFEQFKILKSEKKHKDALVMLVSSYVINAYAVQGIYFNKNKFMKDVKTTAKAIGFSEEAQMTFADDLETAIKAKHIKVADVKQFCADYYAKLGV